MRLLCLEPASHGDQTPKARLDHIDSILATSGTTFSEIKTIPFEPQQNSYSAMNIWTSMHTKGWSWVSPLLLEASTAMLSSLCSWSCKTAGFVGAFSENPLQPGIQDHAGKSAYTQDSQPVGMPQLQHPPSPQITASNWATVHRKNNNAASARFSLRIAGSNLTSQPLNTAWSAWRKQT